MCLDSAMVPLGSVADLRTEKATSHKNGLLPYVGLEHMAHGAPVLLGTAPSASSTSTNSVFHSGDILFGKLRPNLRKSLQAPLDGYCSTDILVLRVAGHIDPKYAARLFQTEDVFRTAIRTAEGTKMPRTSWKKLKQHLVFVPPLPEQRRIAEILDTIDDAIQATEALIAKLRQARAGLLHDLLTRGIDEHGRLRDPDAHPEQFKDSPLGRIPGGWRILNLGSVATVESGVTLGRNIPNGPGTVQLPYLRVANVQDGYIDLSEIKSIGVFRSEVERYSLRRGDVLMNEGGDFDKLGRGAVWDGQIDSCLHQNHVFRVRVDQTALRPEFLAAVSGSSIGKRYFVLSSKQTTNLASINSTQLRAFPIPIPYKEEQDRILAPLSAMDARIQCEQEYSMKLQAGKHGLMRDLLTGRVRARALAEAERVP